MKKEINNPRSLSDDEKLLLKQVSVGGVPTTLSVIKSRQAYIGGRGWRGPAYYPDDSEETELSNVEPIAPTTQKRSEIKQPCDPK